MSRGRRWLALVGLAAFTLASCTSTSSSTSASPADFYAGVPSISTMRAVLGDSAWWPLPPSFGVPPLDATRLPISIRYLLQQGYMHVGTAEQLVIDYEVLASTAISTSLMNFLSSTQASPATTPKLGDSSLYTQTMGTGAAPYESDAYVKVGPTVTVVAWFRKDGYASAGQMARVAAPAISRVKDVIAGKLRASRPAPADQSQLPPPGFNITLLGYTRVPTEAVVLDLGFSTDPQLIITLLHDGGVKDALYGDYVLNTDTHMEVKVTLMDFGDPVVAGQWLDLLRGSAPLDPTGIFSTYSQTTGRYYFAFTSGSKAALMTCQSTIPTEAASRACEDPLGSESAAWKLSLGG